MNSIITLQVTGTGYHQSKACVVTPHVFPVNVLKSVFIEVRLKGLFQMVPIHQPDWTSVPGSTKKKGLNVQKCVYFGVRFQWPFKSLQVVKYMHQAGKLHSSTIRPIQRLCSN